MCPWKTHQFDASSGVAMSYMRGRDVETQLPRSHQSITHVAHVPKNTFWQHFDSPERVLSTKGQCSKGGEIPKWGWYDDGKPLLGILIIMISNYSCKAQRESAHLFKQPTHCAFLRLLIWMAAIDKTIYFYFLDLQALSNTLEIIPNFSVNIL